MWIYQQGEDGRIAHPPTPDQSDFKGAALIWIDIDDTSGERFDQVAAAIGAHALAIEQCRGDASVPKITEFPNHLFITWSFLRDSPETDKLETTTLRIFLGRNYIVTVHGQAMPELQKIHDKLEQDPSMYRGQPASILYSVLDCAVDAYFPLVEGLTDTIDGYMESLLSDEGVGDLQTILLQKHRNMAVRRVVAQHRDVVMKLAGRDTPYVPEGLTIYMIDIYDHLIRITAEVDNNADLISASLDIHLNMVSNRLNVTMKRLTAIATIFMPLTFLVGLYGMNFRHMPELSWKFGYLAAWLVLIAIGVGMYILLKKKGWF